MVSQIDKQLKDLITLDKITDNAIAEYLGKFPDDLAELLSILKNLRSHIRTYGRKIDSLEKYIENIKTRARSNSE